MDAFEYMVKVENFVHFLGCSFRNKKCWHFEFFTNQILSNYFSFLIKWYGSATAEITDRRAWKHNWNRFFDGKLVYILGKTAQDKVLNSYLRQVASSQVTSF